MFVYLCLSVLSQAGRGGPTSCPSARLLTPAAPLILSGNHHETITFHVIRDIPLVLGHPWFVRHNPHIEWSAERIIGWSNFCHSVRLQSALSPGDGNSSPSVAPEPPSLSYVPPQYLDLWEVACQHWALSLPPHRPYDCAIDQLLGAPLTFW